ncbi:hypothetical protein OTU49_006550 [Cherax quadricarinatus]|uniref:Uncharacterized protein n=1 Tax=Cherax quadricarinatus TaxID=27406 RepID=A0AAW0WZ18_CHEQU
MSHSVVATALVVVVCFLQPSLTSRPYGGSHGGKVGGVGGFGGVNPALGLNVRGLSFGKRFFNQQNFPNFVSGFNQMYISHPGNGYGGCKNWCFSMYQNQYYCCSTPLGGVGVGGIVGSGVGVGGVGGFGGGKPVLGLSVAGLPFGEGFFTHQNFPNFVPGFNQMYISHPGNGYEGCKNWCLSRYQNQYYCCSTPHNLGLGGVGVGGGGFVGGHGGSGVGIGHKGGKPVHGLNVAGLSFGQGVFTQQNFPNFVRGFNQMYTSHPGSGYGGCRNWCRSYFQSQYYCCSSQVSYGSRYPG